MKRLMLFSRWRTAGGFLCRRDAINFCPQLITDRFNGLVIVRPMCPVGCNASDQAKRPIAAAKFFQDFNIFVVFHALSDPFQSYRGHKGVTANLGARIR